MTERKTGNQYTQTSFRNGCRRAGMGMLYDDYSEESSGRGRCAKWESVRFPNDDVKPETLNGEVIIIQKGRTKDA